jgi:hypothetical protein
MKKLSIVLIGLVLISGFAFAQTLEERVAALESGVMAPAFTVSGYGQVTFGINLDGGSTGFSNATEARLRITLLANGKISKSGEGDAYGQIGFKDVRVFGDSTATDTAVIPRSVFDYARIVSGNLKVTVAAAPTINLNLESAIRGAIVPAPQSHDGLNVFTALPTFSGTLTDQLTTSITTTGGITIDYALPDVADIKVGFASVTGWDQDNEAVEDANDYAFYGQVVVKAVENATITLRAMTGLALGEAEYPLGIGAKFEYALAIDAFTVRPIVGLDVVKAAGSDDFQIAIGNGVRFQWAGPTEFSLPHGWGGTDDAWSGATVGYSVLLPVVDGADPVVNLNAAIVEDEATGLMPGLGFIFSMGINDLLADGDLQLGLATQASYKVGDLTPYARLAMVPSTEATTLWAGLKVANVLPLTSLEFAYKSGNFGDADNTLGTFATTLKVSY